MSDPFVPQQNGLSKREVVFNAIRGRDTGTLIPYGDLPYGRRALPSISAVAKTMEREQKRTLVCIPTVGWKIVAGEDHINQVARTRKQAARRQGRSVAMAQSVDRRELSGEGQRRADAELITATNGYRALRGFGAKVNKIGLDDIREWREREGTAS